MGQSHHDTYSLDAKRRLPVPVSLAPASPGDTFEARFDAEENELVFRRIAGAGDWLAVLSECTVSMDDLLRGRRAPANRLAPAPLHTRRA